MHETLARLAAGQQMLSERLERDQAVRRMVDEMSEHAHAAQTRILDELDRSRRRSTWMVLTGMALVAAAVVVSARWLAGTPGGGGADASALMDARLLPVVRDLAALRDDSERVLARTDEVLVRSAGWREDVDGTLARLRGLEQALTARAGEPDGADAAARAALESSLAAAEAALLAERERADALAARLEGAERRLAAVTSERNDQIGIATRLQSETATMRQQIADALALVESERARQEQVAADAARPPIDASPRAIDPTASLRLLNEALQKSGVAGFKVLELGGLSGGRATDLLVYRNEPFAPAATLAAAAATLVVDPRGAALRLEGVRDPREPGSEPLAQLDVPLPRVDVAAWESAGLASPRPLAPRHSVEEALAALLASTTFTLDALGGWDGEALLDLVLTERDVYGATLRTVRATRGRLDPAGPSLALEDGTFAFEGEAPRPFFRGTFRLELPGADLAAWRRAVAAP